MKKTIVALAALALAGCASLENAGYSDIEVKQSANGKGCDLRARDGKEHESSDLEFDGEKCKLTVGTAKTRAFRGQAISAKAATVLPLNDVVEILGK